MKFTAEQIAGFLEGEIIGNPKTEVFMLSKIEEGKVGSLTFLSNPKYKNYIYNTQASIAIVNNDFVIENDLEITLIKVKDAYAAFAKLLEFYNQNKQDKLGIESQSIISSSVTYGTGFYLGSFSVLGENVVIGNNVKIQSNCFIGDNVKIDDNSIIFAGTKIHSETEIGKNCNIYSGCVIGADGFGFAPNPDGTFKKIPQIGNVVIKDNVDIGANTTIDRATLGSTVINKGVKLDNQIQIAHNVEIGENTVIAAQTGIAGTTKIGRNCMIGGQVGIAGHLIIGDNVKIQAQSGIGKNIKDNEVIQGSPSFGYNDYMKSYIHFKNLPKIINEFEELKKIVKESWSNKIP